MENLIFTAAGLSAVMLPLLAFFILAKKSGKAVPALWGVLLFGAYGAAVFRLTGAGTVYDLCRYGLETDFTHINLIPFSQIKSRLDLQGYVAPFLAKRRKIFVGCGNRRRVFAAY